MSRALLSADNVGQQVTDLTVKAVKVFCPRTKSNFVSFMTDGRFMAAGTSKIDVIEGGTYVISGKVTLWNERVQVKLSSIKPAESGDNENVLTAVFLADNIAGLGKAISAALVDEFGDEVLDVLLNDPEKASDKVKSLTKEKAMAFCDVITEKEEFFREGLAARRLGLTQEQVKTLYGMGELSVEKIKENPYVLLSKGIADFTLCDKIAIESGFDTSSQIRAAAAISAAAEAVCDETKSTRLRPVQVRKKAFTMLNAGECTKLTSDEFSELYPAACRMAVDNKEIAVFSFADDKCSATDPLDTDAFISPMHYFKAEAAIKRRIEKFLAKKVKAPVKAESDHIMSKYADKIGLVLDEAQLNALYLCMYCPFCIITGGPGTGKTTIMGILADYFREKNITCVFAAPTGRAAKRLAESTGSPAATIHRMLGVRPIEDMTGTTYFIHDHTDTIKARVIVIDEMSMVDTELFERLLDATDESTSLILVGDPDQLPSVGCGNVLRDLLSARSIPSARLTYAHRQNDDSSIASNAYRILNGEPLVADGTDFDILKTSNDEEAFERVKNMLRGMRNEDAVFLTPTKNENVLLGTVKLNAMLQEMFVSEAGGKDELPHVKRGSTQAFFEGDRVMQTRNDYSAEWLDPLTGNTEQGVFNGEMGIVESVDPIEGTMNVLFDDGKTVKYTKKMLEDIELAYAVTVHKSQGCEFEHVIILLGKMNALLYKRNLLYTAVTRGRSKVTIVDSADTLSHFLKGTHIEERSTSLKALLAIVDHKRGF
ncbi:MAG: hypothetical protein E7386_05085 [Ruminococcaceae bacterium]|nr:hypothetical protein [Oscillospiraceae bacterium]